jgi:hypothetical protein
MGRRTFETGDPDSYVGNYEFQLPIFVLTHQPPEDTIAEICVPTYTYGITAADG